MPDFLSQTSTKVPWVDDLLVRDLSGRLKPYHQTKNTPPSETRPVDSRTVLEVAPPHELTTLNVAPFDANFDFFHGGGQAHEPAIFVFHPEDHEQIENFNLNLPTDESKKYSLEKITQRIAEKNNLLLDKNNQEIFNNILFDYFRNRKNYVITRGYLIEKVLSNGHNLSNQVIDHIGSIVKGIKERIDAEGGLVVRQSDIKKDLVLEAKKEVKPKIIDSFPPVKMATDFVEAKKSEPAKVEPIKVELKPKVEEQIPEIVSTPSMPKVMRGEQISPVKPLMSDVVAKANLAPSKEKAVLTGPVQELENMLLSTFRRYGNTAPERAQKLLQKINTLEKESVTKKTMGIAAWRKSPVYKLYLDLGASSLIKGQEVSQMIAEQKAAGQEVLTIEEFNAIGDLNKLLRF